MTKDDVRVAIARLYQIDQDLETLFMIKSNVRKLILELTTHLERFFRKEERKKKTKKLP